MRLYGSQSNKNLLTKAIFEIEKCSLLQSCPRSNFVIGRGNSVHSDDFKHSGRRKSYNMHIIL